MEQDTMKRVSEKVGLGVFRNKSHFIEMAVLKLLEENQIDNT